MKVKEIKKNLNNLNNNVEVHILLGMLLNYASIFKDIKNIKATFKNIENDKEYLKNYCMLELTENNFKSCKEIIFIFSQTIFHNEFNDCLKCYKFFFELLTSSNYDNMLDLELVKAIRKILNVFQN